MGGGRWASALERHGLGQCAVPHPHAALSERAGVRLRGGGDRRQCLGGGSGAGFQGDLVEHWNGTAWTILPVTERLRRPTTTLWYLTAASALNATDAYVVGRSTVGTMSSGGLYQCTTTECHYLAGLSGLSFGGFDAVAALAANDVWVLGGFSNTGSFAAHWDGSTLTQYPLTIGPTSIAAVASNNIWVVGSSGIVHWDGASWQPVSSPTIGPLMLSPPAPPMMCGRSGSNGGALHWDGSTWTAVSTPAATLAGVAAPAPNSVWAVGNDAQEASLILHYTDQQFEDVPPANPFYPLCAVAGLPEHYQRVSLRRAGRAVSRSVLPAWQRGDAGAIAQDGEQCCRLAGGDAAERDVRGCAARSTFYDDRNGGQPRGDPGLSLWGTVRAVCRPH